MKLSSKVAVITGACGGIGRALIHQFRADGASVLAVDLDEEQVTALATGLGEGVEAFAADVTDYTQVQAMLEAAESRFGTLDVLVNNAGIGMPKPLLEHDPIADWNPVTAVNQCGVYYGILAAGKAFQRLGKPGVIVNTSSVYGTMAAELSFTYNVSKAAVDMMTKCAALELAPLNVRVCAVAPGRVDTPLLKNYEALGLWEHIRREHMRETFTQPEEIAQVVAFLASEQANCINGSTVAADDGFLSFKYPLLPPRSSASV
jgi:meso-butanediol dehydrogenase/(S,S)-butanediol dehydrogenase/diacetyl reductase